MRWRQGRTLAMALAVCLALCPSMHTDAAEPDISDEWIETELPETRPEDPGEQETATPSNLPEPQYAEEPILSEDLMRICETMDEFTAELEKDMGGAIGFSGEGPFVLTRDEEFVVTQPVTVYFPPSGLEMDEYVSVFFRGPVTFEGKQGFTVREGSILGIYGGAAVKVSEGGTAVTLDTWTTLYADSSVVLQSEGEYAAAIVCTDEGYLDLGYARIIASGSNAAGIYCSNDIRICNAFVEAEGDNSYAIYSQDQMELVMVSVTGTVKGSPVYSVLSSFSQPPQNLIETNIISDMHPEQTVVYQDLAGKSYPIAFPEYIFYEYYYETQYRPSSALDAWLAGAWIPDAWVAVDCTATWDLGGLDYAVPDIYIATATLEPVIPALDLTVPPITHEIIVVSKERVALYSSGGDGWYSAVQLLAPITEAKNILLWIYEEETGWRELTSTGSAVYASEWNPSLYFSDEFWDLYPAIQISGLEKKSYYWVTVQVIGGPMEGFSNLWRLYTGTDEGGDRTGTDRGGVMPTTMPSGAGNPDGDNSSSGNDGTPSGGDRNISPNETAPNAENHIINDEPAKDIQPPDTAGESFIETEGKAISIFEPVPTATSALVPKADNQQKNIEMPAADKPLPFDPEQSAPEPEYPANTLIVFFISAAALGGGALLYLRFGRPERRRHGRT